jgi:LysM repeat protein
MPRITLPSQALVPREAPGALEPTELAQPEQDWEPGGWDPRDDGAAGRALVPVRERARSVELPESGGLIVRGTGKVSVALPGRPREKAPLKHRVPLRIMGYVAAVLVVGLAFAAPSLASTATASACTWYTVKPGDTLTDISAANAVAPSDVARANHGRVTDKIYVGEQLCLPTVWFAQAQASKYTIPQNAPVALPPGIWAGEPCTADRSIVWTIPVSRWAVPPGCFGLIYHPNPRDYMVNGQMIGAFGWCNWWPEALLRNPNVLNWPGHAAPRVGFPVWYAPQYGEHLGHYAFVESIGSGVNSGWLLISEMNMYWRGGGWAAVDYRYIRADYPGASYLYPN